MDNQLGRYHREPFTLKEISALVKSSGFEILDHFVHSENTGDIMNISEIEAMSDRLKNKVALLRGTDCYYLYENKAREIAGRLNKSGIQRPRHITFILRSF
jgi:hypothetical protein